MYIVKYPEPGAYERANGDLAQEYVEAGATRNMLPLCWGVDWIGAVPRLCRNTARRGKLYCADHLDQEENKDG